MKKLKFIILPVLLLILSGCPDPDVGGKGGETISVSEVEITGITANSTSIVVTWTDPDGIGLDHINAVCSDGTDDDVATGDQTYTFTGLTADTGYSISFVTAYTNAETSNGNIISVSTTTSGSSDHVVVSTAAGLDNIRNDLHGEYLLTADIDLSDYQAGSGWVPIGNSSTYFYGILNGNGHTITGLVINTPADDYAGLFGYCYGAAVCNLNIENADLTGNDRIGALTGFAFSSTTIVNCSSSGSVTGARYIGGLAGLISGASITNSNSTATVTAETQAGGLGGYIENGTIANSYAAGTVTASGDLAGGLIGTNRGSILNSHATGSINAGVNYTGGLVAYNSGEIQDSYATGTVIGGTGDNTGGLVGFNQDTIERSYATGSVSGVGCIGGLIGYNFGDVSNSYATGAVTASDVFSGGLVGIIDGSGHFIENCFSTGLVTSTAGNVGGLVGVCFTGTIVTSSYCDIETSTQTTINGGTGLTTSEMQDSSNFSGWDFTDIWDIDPSINSGYPFLQNTP